MFETSVIRATGQWQKFVAAQVIFIVGGVGLLFAPQYLMQFVGFLLLVGGIGLSWSITCPACGARWVKLAVTTQPASSWFVWLVHLQSCPACKDAGAHVA